MKHKARTFFFLLMVVFLMGVLAHLLIPIQIVVNATQKFEQAYNGYKIQVQQSTVRSIAYLNSLAISNQIQIYENVRSAVIRLYETGADYQQSDISKVRMNNAYQLANSDPTTLDPSDLQHSMWFITGVKQIQQTNEVQQWIIAQYAQFQQYLDALNINDHFHLGLKSIQITINFEGEQVYFQFPSSVNSEFKNINTSLLNNVYNLTVQNYETEERYITMVDQKQNLKACSPILDSGYAFAVVCLKLDVQAMITKITSVLKVPDFQLSTSRYYLLKAIYRCQNQTFPQIIANFSSDNLQKVSIPTNMYFQQLTQDIQTLFSSQQNYILNVQQVDQTKTYYITPIQTYNNIDKVQIITYLVVVNDFAKSSLKSSSHYKQFFVIMLVPSTILLFIAALVMYLMMRPLFSKLNYYTTLIRQSCHFMHKNDMNLQIYQQGETSDFIQIFNYLKHLNLLNKLSTSNYMKVSQNQRIVKLLRAEQFFNHLGYKDQSNKINIYQNLAQCYQRIGQIENALKYMQLSVNCALAELGGQQSLESYIKQQASTNQKKTSPSIRHLRYKIYKLCTLLYQIYIPGDTTTSKYLQKNVNILRILLKGNFSREYAYCFLLQSICSFYNGADSQEIEDRLQAAGDLIRRIQISSTNNQKLIPCEVLKSYRYYLKGLQLKRQQRYLEAYQNFIVGLDGMCFDPQIHLKIKQQIQQILFLCKMDASQLDNIFSYLNMKEKNREFIFLSDISNPSLTKQSYNEWKTKARKMCEYIFDNYIEAKDRVGINQFWTDFRVACNLIQKGTSQIMLKKEMMSSIKARDQVMFSQLIPNLKRVIDRTKKLKKEKIYITILKQGIQVDAADIIKQIKNCQDSTFIFLVQEGSARINIVEQGFYVVDFECFEDIDIILGQKVIKRADNIIYLF